MTITLASCTERPARADIDPLLTAYFQELRPGMKVLDNPPLDICVWVEDFWRQSDKYLPTEGSTGFARNAAGLTVGKRWLSTCPRNLGIMLSAFMGFQKLRLP